MLELFDKVFITKFRAAMNREGLSDIFAVILLEITLSDLRLQKILLIRVIKFLGDNGFVSGCTKLIERSKNSTLSWLKSLLCYLLL